MRFVPLTLLLTACPSPSTDCTPASITPTGDLAQDLVGTFGSWGIDSPVYYVFEASGAWCWVEAPNIYATTGLQGEGQWTLDGDLLTIEEDNEDGVPYVMELGVATVDADTLTVDSDGARQHPRVTCTGYGF
ncbi:MAG: hypothetical protein H6739_00985 [Alphaproteobacteria bacterium]|nr:hypothetical protein [Alphaproteobacteria bacterium]